MVRYSALKRAPVIAVAAVAPPAEYPAQDPRPVRVLTPTRNLAFDSAFGPAFGPAFAPTATTNDAVNCAEISSPR